MSLRIAKVGCVCVCVRTGEATTIWKSTVEIEESDDFVRSK